MRKVTRIILTAIGTISVGLGIIGVFLPLLPTTPFLLLGAACYIRGSERLYNWLINNKLLGKYILDYRQGNGISLRVKLVSISLLWITIGYSIVYVIPVLVGKLILFLIAVGVTLHLLSIKTLKRDRQP